MLQTKSARTPEMDKPSVDIPRRHDEGLGIYRLECLDNTVNHSTHGVFTCGVLILLPDARLEVHSKLFESGNMTKLDGARYDQTSNVPFKYGAT